MPDFAQTLAQVEELLEENNEFLGDAPEEDAEPSNKEAELSTDALHLTTNGLNDDGNAACVIERYNVAHNEALGWLFYSGTHWDRDGANASIKKAIVETLKARIGAAMKHEEQDRWPAFFKYCAPTSGNVRGGRIPSSSDGLCCPI
ncbi:MAG: hypothetical protein R3A44_10315 [Caldilineaceae bacterium]